MTGGVERKREMLEQNWLWLWPVVSLCVGVVWVVRDRNVVKTTSLRPFDFWPSRFNSAQKIGRASSFYKIIGKLTRLRFTHPTTQTPDLSCNDIRAKITPPPPLATTPARTTIHQPAATPTAHRKGRMIGAKMNIMIHARSLMAVSFPYQMPQQCRSFADTLPRSSFVRHPCLFVFIHTNNFCD